MGGSGFSKGFLLLPAGIDGLCAYTIVNGASKKVNVLQTDGRKWKKSSQSSWRDLGLMRYADCQGSFKCENDKCPFRIQYGVINRTQVKKQGDMASCRVCGEEMVYVACPAWRYLKIGKKNITVFHCGEHTCPIQEKASKPTERVEDILRKNPERKPSQVQSAFVLSALRSGEDWNKVVNEASQMLDKKWIENRKQDLKKTANPAGENFEAVATFKEYCDKEDQLLVFRINDWRCNPKLPSYVFKTSNVRMLIAENMNREGDHFMKDEYCYFDGKVKRCKNFVTLTASTYHPLLKRQVVLAVMEAEREDSENIELFWMLFNEALSQATGTKDTVFIPIGWCTDMAGANINGLERGYGKEVLERVKSCEFHFKENRNKMAQKLKDNEEAQQFKELCDALLAARMVETYCSAKDSLESFIQNKPERSFLSSWVDWWHSRRQFIFRAFSPNEAAPRMNQAEFIHASWSHRDRSNLSLLDAAQADVRDSVMLEAELKAFKLGNTKGGSGPSYGERRKKSHQQEISRATQLGKEMSKLRGNLVDPSSGHRPPQEKAGKGKKGTSRSVPKRSNQPGPARQLHANASQTDTGQSQPHTFLSHPYTNHSQQCANPLQRYPNQS